MLEFLKLTIPEIPPWENTLEYLGNDAWCSRGYSEALLAGLLKSLVARFAVMGSDLILILLHLSDCSHLLVKLLMYTANLYLGLLQSASTCAIVLFIPICMIRPLSLLSPTRYTPRLTLHPFASHPPNALFCAKNVVLAAGHPFPGCPSKFCKATIDV